MIWQTNWRRDRRTSLPDGEWKPVVGFPNYWVSAAGEIFTEVRGQLLRQRIANTGYRYVHLCRDGVPSTRTVHSIVIEAFIGPKPPDLETRHLDGNALNNRRENLEYCTSAQNKADTVAHGRHINASKTHCLQGHPFDFANTRRETPGKRPHRHCRACDELRNRRRKRAKLR